MLAPADGSFEIPGVTSVTALAAATADEVAIVTSKIKTVDVTVTNKGDASLFVRFGATGADGEIPAAANQFIELVPGENPVHPFAGKIDSIFFYGASLAYSIKVNYRRR
jgi:hypothetical protein